MNCAYRLKIRVGAGAARHRRASGKVAGTPPRAQPRPSGGLILKSMPYSLEFGLTPLSVLLWDPLELLRRILAREIEQPLLLNPMPLEKVLEFQWKASEVFRADRVLQHAPSDLYRSRSQATSDKHDQLRHGNADQYREVENASLVRLDLPVFTPHRQFIQGVLQAGRSVLI
jgi:hypothetical protein